MNLDVLCVGSNEWNDVDTLMEQFYTYDDSRKMKATIRGIQEPKIQAKLI